MADLTDDEIWDEATKTANGIESVLAGKPAIVSYTALAMVIGEAAAKGPRPNFHRAIHAISDCAFGVFRRRIQAND